jgi:CHAT domain-containing protein
VEGAGRGDEHVDAARVYKNLWTKKMGRLEALREAQIWMLNNGRTSGGETGRGITLEEAEDVPAGNRLPPRYWAAFVLSGDWR